MSEKVSQRPTVLHGPLRFIVRSAHKWGGNGTKPDFNKIKRVLTTRHPEVVAKVFQGDANKAAAWIKDAWMRYYGRSERGKHGSGPTYWRRGGRSRGRRANLAREVDVTELLLEYTEVPGDWIEEEELFMSSDRKPVEKDGVVWVEATRTGKWARNPIKGARGPLVIDDLLLDKMIDNFKAGAWEHVEVPLADDDDDKVHKSLTRYNTGTVVQLRKAKDPDDDRTVLLAGIKFTDKEAEKKVLEGSIRGRSIGSTLSGTTDTETGKRYEGPVLKHIALTNKPWVNRLKPGAVDPEQYLAASQLEEDDTVEILLADIEPDEPLLDDEEAATIGGEADDALLKMVEDEDLSTEDDDEELAAAKKTDDELGVMPKEAEYRVATDRAARCENCRFFNRSGTNKASGYDMGECTHWDAPAHSDHVSTGFQAKTTKAPAMHLSKPGTVVKLLPEEKVLRLKP
jgi:hypothetical protein